MAVLDHLLESFDPAKHPRGHGGKFIDISWNPRTKQLEGSFHGVKLERGIAYQGKLATGHVFTGHWTGEVDGSDGHPIFKHVDTGERRTFRGGSDFSRLSDVKPSGYPGGMAPHPGESVTNKAKALSRAKALGKAHPERSFGVGRSGQSGFVVLSKVQEAADSMAKASTPEPFSRSRTSNWVARAGGLPDYIQHIAHDLMEKRGKTESEAIQMAIGIVKRWCRGGGKVDANTRAAACKAVSEWEAKKASAHAKSAVQHSAAYKWRVPLLADELAVRDAALERIALLEQQFGTDGLTALLAGAVLQEASQSSWSPTLKRTASASAEMERHEVHDGSGQHVGTISRRPGFRQEPDRYMAHAVNGERVTDYSGTSKDKALEALRKHLEEAPARVGKHSSGKWLVARPASYSGPDTFSAFPSQSAARYAAGLPEKPSQPEQGSQVQQLAEMLRMDLMTVSDRDIPPLRRVQEARRCDPLELAEAFHADELRDFHGRWRGGGARSARLSPSSVMPGPRVRSRMAAADVRYEGGVSRASARARAAHAAKPQIAQKDLAGSIGRGEWSASADRVSARLLAQPTLEAESALRSAISAGKAIDTERAHRKVNPDGSLGRYSRERQRLHEAIIASLLQGKKTHEGHARAIFTAGGPASGKGGLVKTGDADFEREIGKEAHVDMPSDVVYADPDVIRKMLPEYKALLAAGRADAANVTHEEASYLAKLVTRSALGSQHHILVDGVGDSGPGKFAAKIKAARDAGHRVEVHYATTSIVTALARAKKREAESGRAVPEDLLRKAHATVSERFGEIAKIPGIHVRVIDTTNRPNTVVASRGPNRGDKLVIRDGAMFRRFLDKAKGGGG